MKKGVNIKFIPIFFVNIFFGGGGGVHGGHIQPTDYIIATENRIFLPERR